ncbi:hypothetical protein WOLCODRAFT_153614 [Wolfiporia cocos MD-104 SS10]|uniref:Uncharacterized protein n=1 Tax=Wolfiporia cocos (strain MD-104) TaxID=742152 RepID=A0A2H3JUB6_WOLCO|nr:hypothetical protein WOLCODRAFT_153614 [Wolfiporia cocos MD-104 SS10]
MSITDYHLGFRRRSSLNRAPPAIPPTRPLELAALHALPLRCPHTPLPDTLFHIPPTRSTRDSALPPGSRHHTPCAFRCPTRPGRATASPWPPHNFAAQSAAQLTAPPPRLLCPRTPPLSGPALHVRSCTPSASPDPASPEDPLSPPPSLSTLPCRHNSPCQHPLDLRLLPTHPAMPSRFCLEWPGGGTPAVVISEKVGPRSSNESPE